MGVILEAVHAHLGERVALKVLRSDAASSEYKSRFLQEARAVARLKSPHIARVHDAGEVDGTPYIVMEFLEGRDLAGVLEGGPLPIAVAAEYAIQICEAVSEAHANRIVHRDLKPENVFLLTAKQGLRIVKVLDFGIAKATLPDASGSKHETRSLMGSPAYMSPEQLRSTRDVDHRTDIWSIGVVLFELLSGCLPFPYNPSLPATVAAILENPHERLDQLAPDVPAALAAAVDRCLEKDPAQRFQTAAELALALLPFAPPRCEAVADRALKITRASHLAQFARDLEELPSLAPEAEEGRVSRVSIPRLLVPGFRGDKETLAAPSTSPPAASSKPTGAPPEEATSRSARPAQVATAVQSALLVLGGVLLVVLVWSAIQLPSQKDSPSPSPQQEPTPATRVPATYSGASSPRSAEPQVASTYGASPGPSGAPSTPVPSAVRPRSSPNATYRTKSSSAPPPAGTPPAQELDIRISR